MTYLSRFDYAPEELDDIDVGPVPPFANPAAAAMGVRTGDSFTTNRVCEPCGVRWRGDGPCWLCTPQTEEVET